MVEAETYTIHLTAFIYQPVATPHQSRQNIGSEMPIFHRDSFPPGEAKGVLTFSVYALIGADRIRPSGKAAEGRVVEPVFEQYAAGRVRELPYRHMVRSVIKRPPGKPAALRGSFYFAKASTASLNAP